MTTTTTHPPPPPTSTASDSRLLLRTAAAALGFGLTALDVLVRRVTGSSASTLGVPYSG